MKNILPITIVAVLALAAAAGAWWFFGVHSSTAPVTTNTETETIDRIRVNNPRPNQTISSPLTVTGEARGSWYFEASFPVLS